MGLCLPSTFQGSGRKLFFREEERAWHVCVVIHYPDHSIKQAARVQGSRLVREGELAREGSRPVLGGSVVVSMSSPLGSKLYSGILLITELLLANWAMDGWVGVLRNVRGKGQSLPGSCGSLPLETVEWREF